MKLNVEQRTKLFSLIRKRVIKNSNDCKLEIISSDHPNKALYYEDDDYKILIYYNLYGIGVTSNEALMVSLKDKKCNKHIKFDSSDYYIMKNGKDYYQLVKEINSTLFDKDTTDSASQSDIDNILKQW